MSFFSQAKDLYKLQKQAKQMKAELKNLHIEVDTKDIQVTVSAEMEIMKVNVGAEWFAPERKMELEKTLLEAINKGLKKAQDVAAEKMRGMMGGMGMDIPGMTAEQ